MKFTDGRAVISIICLEASLGTKDRPIDKTASVFASYDMPKDTGIRCIFSSNLESLSAIAHRWENEPAGNFRIVFEEIIGTASEIEKDEWEREERHYQAKKRFVYNVWEGAALYGSGEESEEYSIEDAEGDLNFFLAINPGAFKVLDHYYLDDDVWITPDEYKDLWNEFSRGEISD